MLNILWKWNFSIPIGCDTDEWNFFFFLDFTHSKYMLSVKIQIKYEGVTQKKPNWILKHTILNVSCLCMKDKDIGFDDEKKIGHMVTVIILSQSCHHS